MNPNTDHILSRLDKVKGRNGSWVACCPAHKDRNPSMTIRETQDGKILMHCFAGCSVQEIAESIGIDLSDLFPPEDKIRNFDYTKMQKRERFLAADLLQAIAFEASIVSIAAYEMANGKQLKERDRERLCLAYQRINEALEASRG